MRSAVGGFRDPVDVRHEARQILEAPPESIDVGDRDLQADRFPHMHAAPTAESRLRGLRLAISVKDLRPTARDTAVQQWGG